MNPLFGLADLHTHTALCRHASGTPEEYLAEAKRKGLACLGVSDHFPAPAGYDADFRMKKEEFRQYSELVSHLKEKGRKIGVEVLYGAEFDYVPGRMDEVHQALEDAQSHGLPKFDYLIGSVHYVHGFAYDDPDKVAEWQQYGADQIWEWYLDDLYKFVKTEQFHILAHPDLPKKFGFRHSNPAYILERYRAILRLASKKRICLELNTCGLRVPASEIYPSPDLLQIAFESAMQITFGSDAHKPEYVGADFDAAASLAMSCGWNDVIVFHEGVPSMISLRRR